MNLLKKITDLIKLPIHIWVRIVVLVLVVWGIYYVTSTFTLISIIVQDSTNNPGEAEIISERKSIDAKAYTPLKVGPISIAYRDTVTVRAVSGYAQTSKQVDGLPFLWSGTLQIDIKQDMNADKVGTDSRDCSLYNISDDTPVSVDCINNTINRYAYTYTLNQSTKQWFNQGKRLPRLSSIEQFNDGMIGVKQDRSLETTADDSAERQIFISGFNSEPQSFPAPGDVLASVVRFGRIATDPTRESPHFIYSSIDGYIYIGTKTNDTITYQKVERPKNYSQRDATLCALEGEKAYCYQGESNLSVLPHEGDEHSEPTVKTGLLREIDFSTPTPKVIDYTTRAGLMLNAIATKNNTIVGLGDDKNLYTLEKRGSSIKDSIFAKNIISIATSNEILYSTDRSVFSLVDTKTSQAVFTSKRLSIKSISSYLGNTTIKASIDGAGTNLHTYKLTNELNETAGSRLIDILPLDFRDSVNISNMNLVKDSLYIRVMIPVSRKGDGIDTEMLENTKNSVRTELSKAGVDVNSLDLHFSY